MTWEVRILDATTLQTNKSTEDTKQKSSNKTYILGVLMRLILQLEFHTTDINNSTKKGKSLIQNKNSAEHKNLWIRIRTACGLGLDLLKETGLFDGVGDGHNDE